MMFVFESLINIPLLTTDEEFNLNDGNLISDIYHLEKLLFNFLSANAPLFYGYVPNAIHTWVHGHRIHEKECIWNAYRLKIVSPLIHKIV
jgi:hypothetical protein